MPFLGFPTISAGITIILPYRHTLHIAVTQKKKDEGLKR